MQRLWRGVQCSAEIIVWPTALLPVEEGGPSARHLSEVGEKLGNLRVFSSTSRRCRRGISQTEKEIGGGLDIIARSENKGHFKGGEGRKRRLVGLILCQGTSGKGSREVGVPAS